jgi:carboxylesterase type B
VTVAGQSAGGAACATLLATPAAGTLFHRARRSRANPAYGAVHCLDIPFVFDNLDAGRVVEVTGADPPQALADAMHEAWVSFVRDGDPGWARYDADARVGRRFDEHGGSDVEHLWAFERDAWLRH